MFKSLQTSNSKFTVSYETPSTDPSVEIKPSQSSTTATTDFEPQNSTCLSNLLLPNIIDKKYLIQSLCKKSKEFHANFINNARVQYFESIQQHRTQIVSYFGRNEKALNVGLERKRVSINAIFLATSIADTYLMAHDLDIHPGLLRETIWRMACKFEVIGYNFHYKLFNCIYISINSIINYFYIFAFIEP